MDSLATSGQAFRKEVLGTVIGVVHGEECEATIMPALTAVPRPMSTIPRLDPVRDCGVFLIVKPLRVAVYVWKFGFRLDRVKVNGVTITRMVELLQPRIWRYRNHQTAPSPSTHSLYDDGA
jgi:hypothetical protein